VSLPWIKFSPAAWRGDQGLRAVSLAARGLWIDCLCIMHEAKPYGHLVLNGEPVDDGTLARITGATVDEVQALMAELRQAGVFGLTSKGVVFSRRMTKDHARAQKGRRAANKRWAQASDDVEQSEAPNGLANAKPLAQEVKTKEDREEKPPPSVQDQGARFSKLWELFPQHPQSSEKAAEQAFEKLSERDQDRVIAAASRFRQWFLEDCQRRDRTWDAGCRFAPYLAGWIEKGTWKEAAALRISTDKSVATIPMTELDRERDADLWKACERVMGKKAPTDGFSWKFRDDVIAQARELLAA
jgi:hypothetical protein